MPDSRNPTAVATSRFGAIALLLTLSTVLSLPSRLCAQESHSEITYPLYVTVEADGKLVQGLGPDHFRVFVDDRSREFRLEKPEKPAAIALLVEYSQSSYWYFSDIARSIEAFLDVAPEGHWYALATYAHNLDIQVDFTKLKGEIPSTFNSLPQPSWNEIDTYDAVYTMLDRMKRMRGRKILIIIGSGFDTFSRHNLDDILKKLETANVIVYAAGTGSAFRGIYEPYLSSTQRLQLLQAQNLLQTMADKTGGQAWFPRFESAFADVMKGTMQDIASQYKLVIPARDLADGKPHKVEVKAFRVVNDEREDFKVRVRNQIRLAPRSTSARAQQAE